MDSALPWRLPGQVRNGGGGKRGVFLKGAPARRRPPHSSGAPARRWDMCFCPQIHMKTMPAAMYRLLTAQEQPAYLENASARHAWRPLLTCGCVSRAASVCPPGPSPLTPSTRRFEPEEENPQRPPLFSPRVALFALNAREVSYTLLEAESRSKPPRICRGPSGRALAGGGLRRAVTTPGTSLSKRCSPLRRSP